MTGKLAVLEVTEGIYAKTNVDFLSANLKIQLRIEPCEKKPKWYSDSITMDVYFYFSRAEDAFGLVQDTKQPLKKL